MILIQASHYAERISSFSFLIAFLCFSARPYESNADISGLGGKEQSRHSSVAGLKSYQRTGKGTAIRDVLKNVVLRARAALPLKKA